MIIRTLDWKRSIFSMLEILAVPHSWHPYIQTGHPNQRGFVKSKSTVTNLATYLNDVLPSVCSQGQFDSVYFGLSQAFDKATHTLLLDDLNNFGQSSFYVNWFQSYLSDRSSSVRILGKFSSPFSVLSGAPQGSTLGPLLFNIFVNDISAKINHSKFLLFADDLKIYRNIKSAGDCKALQVDIDAVQQWCSENGMVKLYLSHLRPTVFILNTLSKMS
jgi:hypothetical protein